MLPDMQTTFCSRVHWLYIFLTLNNNGHIVLKVLFNDGKIKFSFVLQISDVSQY